MKKFKFKVWNHVNKEWIDSSKLVMFSDCSVFYGNIESNEYLVLMDSKYVVFSTGLKDKFGEEIYEGDILSREYESVSETYDPVSLGFVDREIIDSGEFIGAVSYRPSEGWVLNKCKKLDSKGNLVKKMSGVKIYPKYCKVIGNKFEDADILK